MSTLPDPDAVERGEPGNAFLPDDHEVVTPKRRAAYARRLHAVRESLTRLEGLFTDKASLRDLLAEVDQALESLEGVSAMASLTR